MNIKVDEYLASEKFKKRRGSKRRRDIRESGTNHELSDPGKERGHC